MKKVSVISDTTCDLSPELLAKYQVTVFPLHIHLGDAEYSDGVDITPDEIYAWSDKNKATPKTSALSTVEAIEVLKKKLAESEEVVCFCISEQMSACANVMRMAAEELDATDKVFVVDSRNLSTGIGLQVIEAAIMADKGMSAAQIVAEIEKIRPLVRASFVVDTLTYLHRGGRCSGVAALAGSALRLHPYIGVVDGAMHPGKKYRGKMDRVIIDYVKDLEPELKKAKADRVFITHSGCTPEILDTIKKELENLNYFGEILTTRAGSVITSHCGPGTLGVLFIAGE